jgi:hypothetical protein
MSPSSMKDGAKKANTGNGETPAVHTSTAVDLASKRPQKCCLTTIDDQPNETAVTGDGHRPKWKATQRIARPRSTSMHHLLKPVVQPASITLVKLGTLDDMDEKAESFAVQ